MIISPSEIIRKTWRWRSNHLTVLLQQEHCYFSTEFDPSADRLRSLSLLIEFVEKIREGSLKTCTIHHRNESREQNMVCWRVVYQCWWKAYRVQSGRVRARRVIVNVRKTRTANLSVLTLTKGLSVSVIFSSKLLLELAKLIS